MSGWDPKKKKISLVMPVIEKSLKNWAFVPGSQEWNSKITAVMAWLHNFRPSEIEHAVKILENINYYDDNKIRTIITKLSSRIKSIFAANLENVMFFPLGTSSSSSGSMYIYQYRKELGLSETNFKMEGFQNYLRNRVDIIFFDDIIGSGRQAVNFYNKYLEGSLSKNYYFSILALERGIDHIRKNTGYKSTISGEEISDEELAFTEVSHIFTSEEQLAIKPICEKYGRMLFAKHPLGFDDSQALIVFPHNTPNNTLPIIWASEKNEAGVSEKTWNPLFERKKLHRSIEFEEYPEVMGEFQKNRKLHHDSVIEFIKTSFRMDNRSRRIDIAGKSGVGKTYFVKKVLDDLSPEENVLYLDLNSDDFFLNMFHEIAIYNLIPSFIQGGNTRIQENDSFLEFLDSDERIENKNLLMESLYAVIRQLPGMDFPGICLAGNETESVVETPRSNASTYLFRYLNWLTKKRRMYIAIDNYQFLPDRLKEIFEENIDNIPLNLCFIAIYRQEDYDAEYISNIKCFLDNAKTVTLSSLSKRELESFLEAESLGNMGIAEDCLGKTKGNLKEVEYYLAQLRSSNRRTDAIRTLVDNIRKLPDLERYLMTISSLFPTGMTKHHVSRLIQEILLVDEPAFNRAVNFLIEIGYLVLHDHTQCVLKPAHEKIITSLAKSLGEEEFHEIRSSLVSSFESLLSQMTPTKEYNYLLHCFVGVFTAEQFKSKINYVIKLFDIQYKSNRFHYMIDFYKNTCKDLNWEEICPYLPTNTLEQLLDSMQKTSEFYCGQELLLKIKNTKRSDIERLLIYEVKYLTQTYHFDKALELVGTLHPGEENTLYKLNILQHLGNDSIAEEIVRDLLRADIGEPHSEHYYVILRNTAHYFAFDDAVRNIQTALNYFNKKGFKFGAATTENNLGVVYLWARELNTAEQLFLKSEKSLEELGSNEIFEPQCNLSVLYSLREQGDLALLYSKKSLNSFPRNLRYDYIVLQSNQMIIELEQGRASLDQAVEFYRDQHADVGAFMDPWLTFMVEYNLHSLEMLLCNCSEIVPNERYSKDDGKTATFVFKDMEIAGKSMKIVLALSPNWRY